MSSSTRSHELSAGSVEKLRALERSYLESDDPIRQSGFGAGAKRWRAERGPILDAIASEGDLLDVGCANGHLVECLSAWASERGLALTPYGVDFGADLIALARQRLPELAGHFYVGNAWEWEPPRRFRYVYSLIDVAGRGPLDAYVSRLIEHFVEPGGRLIVGDYGSRSRGIAARPVDEILTSFGHRVAGSSIARSLQPTRFAWVDRPS